MKLLFIVTEKEKAEESPHAVWGILKPHGTSPAGRSQPTRTSRVSFRPQSQACAEGAGEERQVEALVDREVEAITGADRESPGCDPEVGF